MLKACCLCAQIRFKIEHAKRQRAKGKGQSGKYALPFALYPLLFAL
jgi:hypothetical protein